MSDKLDGPSSKPTSPDGPPADQEKRMVEQASLTNRLSISWRQKVSPAHGRDPHSDVASESAGPSAGEPDGEPEAAASGNDVTKPSLPHRLRALVPFMSPRKGKEPDTGTGSPPPGPPPTAAAKSELGPSTPTPTAAIKTGPTPSNLPPAAATNTGSALPSVPPAAIKTGTVPPSVSPAAIKTGPLQPGPAALPPAAATSVSPSSGVACTSAACPVHSKPPAAPPSQQPAQTTTSAPSSPGLHPTFAAFLEQAAMVEGARARQAATAAMRTTSPRPAPVQRSPTAAPTTSAPVSTSFHTDCSNSNCVAASRRIHDVRFVQDTFARINANYSTNYDIAEPIRAALHTAYQILLECEYRMIMARVDGVTTMLQQLNGRQTLNNQDVLMHLLRRTGMPISRTAPAPAGTGTTQSAHAGGGPMPAGAATPAPVHTTAPAHTPTAVPHTPAVGYAPAC